MTVMRVRPRSGDGSLVVGATKLAWIYGKSRNWARRLLRSWAEAQARGGPVRVFTRPDGALCTTMAVLYQHMPPGKDLELYRRVDSLTVDVSDAHRRIDQNVRRTTELEYRVARVGGVR